MKLLVLLPLSLLALLASVAGLNPGVRLKITKKGLDAISKFGKEKLNSLIKGIDFEGSLSPGPGEDHSAFKVGKLIMSDHKDLDLDMETIPPNAMLMETKGGFVEVAGPWESELLNEHGLMVVWMKGFNIQMGLEHGWDPVLRRTTHQESFCDAAIDDAGMELYGNGSLPAAMKPSEKIMVDALKAAFAEIACSEAHEFSALFDLNKPMTHSFPHPLEKLVIDNSFVNEPLFGKDFMQLDLRGEVRPKISVPGVWNPPPLDTSGVTDRMVHLWFSEDVQNSFFKSAFNEGLMKERFSHKDVASLSPFLLLHCPVQHTLPCIGDIIPKVRDKYGSVKATEAVVHMEMPTAPLVVYAHDSATIEVPLLFNFLLPTKDAEVPLVEAQGEMIGDVKYGIFPNNKGHHKLYSWVENAKLALTHVTITGDAELIPSMLTAVVRDKTPALEEIAARHLTTALMHSIASERAAFDESFIVGEHDIRLLPRTLEIGFDIDGVRGSSSPA